MFQRSTTLIPVIRTSCGLLRQPVEICSRNIWDSIRVADSRSLVRDLNREIDRMERNFFRHFPFNFAMPRLVPIEDDVTRVKTYRVNIDVDGYKPEDIKISMKNNVIKVEAKMDRTAEDGSRLQQSFVREFTVPDNVDQSTLKSFVHNDGILSIEAGLLKSEQDPRAIPIQQEGEPLKSKI